MPRSPQKSSPCASVEISAPQSQGILGSFKQLVDAVELYSREHKQRLERLLDKSDASLDPLRDPLRTDLGLHRWLSSNREESYSDWLAWVIERLSLDQVRKLLGIERQFASEANGGQLQCFREHTIPGGRLDIYIPVGHSGHVVLEIKKTSEEVADTDKHTVYSDWLRDKGSDCWSRLIAVDFSEEYIRRNPVHFAPRPWSDLCVELRAIVASREFRDKGGIVTSALILAFIGAVEQNLLKLRMEKRGLLYARLTSHLERSLNPGQQLRDKNMDTPLSQDRDIDVLMRSSNSYVDALVAISEFRRALQEAWRAQLKRRLPEIAAALRINLKEIDGKDEDWFKPDSLGKDYNDGAWTAIGLLIRCRGQVCTRQNYYFEWEDGEKSVAASITFSTVSVAKDNLGRFGQDIGVKRKAESLYMLEPITVGESAGAVAAIDKLLTKWCSAWERAGGVVGTSGECSTP